MRKSTENAEAKTPGRQPKKQPARKAHTPATEIYLQVDGKEYDCAALVEQAKADYRSTHKIGIHSCRVYIKPAEGCAYYVINKVDGKSPL